MRRSRIRAPNRTARAASRTTRAASRTSRVRVPNLARSLGAYTVPIGRLISEKTGRAVARGALHTSLDRLRAKGLVTSRLGEPLAIRGGRSRRYFTVTKEGVASLRDARAAVVNMSAGLESVLGRRR